MKSPIYFFFEPRQEWWTKQYPTRILKLLNKDKSGQLAFLLNQSISFFISVNFENLKNYTNIQKRFKDCSDYRATSLHSIIEKNIRLMYNRRYSFLEKKGALILSPVWLSFKTFDCSCCCSFSRSNQKLNWKKVIMLVESL